MFVTFQFFWRSCSPYFCKLSEMSTQKGKGCVWKSQHSFSTIVFQLLYLIKNKIERFCVYIYRIKVYHFQRNFCACSSKSLFLCLISSTFNKIWNFMLIKQKVIRDTAFKFQNYYKIAALPRAIFINIDIKIILNFKLSPILNVRGIIVIKINI